MFLGLKMKKRECNCCGDLNILLVKQGVSGVLCVHRGDSEIYVLTAQTSRILFSAICSLHREWLKQYGLEVTGMVPEAKQLLVRILTLLQVQNGISKLPSTLNRKKLIFMQILYIYKIIHLRWIWQGRNTRGRKGLYFLSHRNEKQICIFMVYDLRPCKWKKKFV